MTSLLRRTCVIPAALSAAALALAQGTPAELGDRAPSDNVRGGAVQERAPGTWITAARERHNGLIEDRVRAARFGINNNGAEGSGPAENSGTSTTGSSGSSLLDMLGSLAGGGLGDLLGGLGGTSGSGASNAGSQASQLSELFPNVPPEVFDAIAGSGIDLSDLLSQRPINSSAGGANGDIRAQSQNNGNASFGARLAITLLETALEETLSEIADFDVSPFIDLPEDDPSMLRESLVQTGIQTLFAALTFGLSSEDFVNSIADSLRPAFGLPRSDEETPDDGATSGTGEPDETNPRDPTGGDRGPRSGEGIEDAGNSAGGGDDGSIV